MSPVKGYVIGFSLSLIFTLAAYMLVTSHIDSSYSIVPTSLLVPVIIFFALLQLIAQLVFFLHLGKESKPYWNIMALSFAVMVVGIVVFGSLWIMQNLNYSHSSPATIDETIIHDEGIE